MGYALSLILAVGLCFLVAVEEGVGLPTKAQVKDYAKKSLTEKEKEHIRGVLELAIKQLKDEDILRVLKESLILRFKVCFSAFPVPHPSPDGMPNGTMEGTFVEDDGSSSEQKMGLRELLLECLDLNEEEILDFLKSSIDFRILYCTLSGVIPKMGSPIPPLPPPGPSPNPIPARKKTTSIPGGTTESSAAPNDGAGKNSISQVDMTRRENRAQDVPASEFKQEGSLVGTSEEVALENALSSISQLENQSVSSEDEPSRAHAVNNDSKEMSKRRLFRELHSVANPAKKISLKNALGPISQREEALAFLLDKPFQERIVEENPTVNLVKQPQGSKTLDSSSETNPYESLAELVASEKNLISESNTTVAEERGQGNEDQSAVNSSDEVRKENLESKEHTSKVTETNTGKGEFASVVRIDYNELAHDQGKTGQELLD